MRPPDLSPDLEPLPHPEESAPVAPATQPAWRIAVALAGCVIAASLGVIAWGQYQQVRLERQQTCISIAEGYMTLDQSQTYPPDQVRLARCLGEHVDVPVPDISVPDLVSMQLGDALRTLATVGLRGGVASGDPSCDQSIVASQAPGPREGVRPLSVVTLRTHAPPGHPCQH